jgi:hypothetical protein
MENRPHSGLAPAADHAFGGRDTGWGFGLKLKHLGRLIADLVHYAVVHRSVGLLVVSAGLIIIAGLLIASQVAVPFIYTVF